MMEQEQIEEMKGDILNAGIALEGIDFAHKSDYFDRLARKLIAAGYRKADEVRKETAQKIFDYIVESTVIRTAPDTIKMFFKDNYGVEVEDEKV